MNPAGTILRVMIRGYQLLVSPVLPGACRYHHTCSSYAMEAVARHGPLPGFWLAGPRVARFPPRARRGAAETGGGTVENFVAGRF